MVTPLYDINKLMKELIGLPELYDIKYNSQTLDHNVTQEEAQPIIDHLVEFNNHMSPDLFYTVKSPNNIKYTSNLDETLKAINKLAQKDNHTFVLSFEDGQWRAAYGNYKDCEEYRGANPAYCSCVALLKFMGKI